MAPENDCIWEGCEPLHELAVRMNVYNVLNSNTVIAVTTRSGPSYGKPTSILPARLAEVSASYKF